MHRKTTVLLDQKTREDLRNMGRKGQSYDSLIQQLICLAQKNTGLTTNTNAIQEPNVSTNKNKKENQTVEADLIRTDVNYNVYEKQT